MNILVNLILSISSFCGDYISDIPKSHEVILYLKELRSNYQCFFIRGNREEYVLDYLKSSNKNWSLENRSGPMLCTLNELTSDDIDFIKELPETLEIILEDVPPIFISHRRHAIQKNFKFILYGHTHKPEYHIEQGVHSINPGSVGLGLSNNFCSEFAILDIEKKYSNVQFINIAYDTKQVLKSINESALTKTRIHWDTILKRTIADGIDYSALYIETVLEKTKKIDINNLDDIPIKIWDEAIDQLFDKMLDSAK